MVRGYLLDANIVACWFNESKPGHASVVEHIEGFPDRTPLRVSAVTLGEIEFGHRKESSSPTPIQVQYSRFVRDQLPYVVDIRRSTAVYYGSLRADLFKKYRPKRRKKPLRPEDLVDPETSLALGIQENDLWIAAQAVEHNLVLVSNDKLHHIRTVAAGMLDIEDWAS